MILYTVQTKEAYDNAKKDGFFVGKREFIMEPSWFEAYEFMKSELKTQKNIKFKKNEFPVWLWIKKPKGFRNFFISKDQIGVLLKVDVPEDRCLISCFSAWHIVLNGGTISKNREKIDKKESWKRIFDFRLLKKMRIRDEDDEKQIVCDRIYLNEIISEDFFISKNKTI